MTNNSQLGTPDLIVIGGGSAGCAVSARLAAAGVRVLLIEAGESRPAIRSIVPALVGGIVHNPDFDWCYVAEPDESVSGRTDVWPAGKRLGGGSAINGMMFVRGHRWDYDHWSSLGATGWDYESVLPFFRRLEDNERGEDPWRGRGGPIAVSECRSRYAITDHWIEAVQQAGYPRSADLNGKSAEGVDHVQLSQRRGLRCSSASGYLALGGDNLQVLANAEVVRIEFSGRTATGVQLRHEGETKTIHAHRGVVVSAGALNSPRILMLSGVGPGKDLQECGLDVVLDVRAVGTNLQEHVGTHLVNEVQSRTLNVDAQGISGVLELLKFAFARRGALTTGIGHAQAFVRTRPGLDAPNVQLAFSAFAFDVTPQGNLVLRPNSSASTFIALARPSSRGSVSLDPGNPGAAPRIRHTLLGSDDDVEQLIEGMTIARRVMQQAAISSEVVSEVRPGLPDSEPELLRQYIRAASIPMYHPVGTARMGSAADPSAVVSPDLDVHGLSGLWVADASIMPTIPAGNTNATAIMIGDKASEHILRKLSH
ncbi:GMC family oxidoreductase [Tsuneonella sp. HG222]